MGKGAPGCKIKEGWDAMGEDAGNFISQLLLHNKQPRNNHLASLTSSRGKALCCWSDPGLTDLG